MVRRNSILCLLIIVAVAGVALVARVPHSSQALGASEANLLPTGFSQIGPGMAVADVIALVGQPEEKLRNPKWENKSAQQWAAIRQQAGDYADSAGGNLTDFAAVDVSRMKAATELEHRIKNTWVYRLSPGASMRIFFDQDGKVIKQIMCSG